jgi:hypothetical protein
MVECGDEEDERRNFGPTSHGSEPWCYSLRYGVLADTQFKYCGILIIRSKYLLIIIIYINK